MQRWDTPGRAPEGSTFKCIISLHRSAYLPDDKLLPAGPLHSSKAVHSDRLVVVVPVSEPKPFRTMLTGGMGRIRSPTPSSTRWTWAVNHHHSTCGWMRTRTPECCCCALALFPYTTLTRLPWKGSPLHVPYRNSLFMIHAHLDSPAPGAGFMVTRESLSVWLWFSFFVRAFQRSVGFWSRAKGSVPHCIETQRLSYFGGVSVGTVCSAMPNNARLVVNCGCVSIFSVLGRWNVDKYTIHACIAAREYAWDARRLPGGLSTFHRKPLSGNGFSWQAVSGASDQRNQNSLGKQ